MFLSTCSHTFGIVLLLLIPTFLFLLHPNYLVFLGQETSSQLLIEWCGQQVPSDYVSTGPNLLLRFRTNHERNNYKGFHIRYWALAASSSELKNDEKNMEKERKANSTRKHLQNDMSFLEIILFSLFVFNQVVWGTAASGWTTRSA